MGASANGLVSPHEDISKEAMGTFRKLKAVRTLLSHLPGRKSYKDFKDFDITIEIGFHQEKGKPLSLKQLLLLEVASVATVRRHLARLIKAGTVIRHVSQDDHRSIHFTLSKTVISSMDHCLRQIVRTLG